MHRISYHLLLSLAFLFFSTTPALAENLASSPVKNAKGFDTAMATHPKQKTLDGHLLAEKKHSPTPGICMLLNHWKPEVRAKATPIIALYGEEGQNCFLTHLESKQPTAAHEILPHLRFTSLSQTRSLISLFPKDLNGAEVSLRKTVMQWGTPAETVLLDAYFEGSINIETAKSGLTDSGLRGEDFAVRYLNKEHDHRLMAIDLAGAMADPKVLQSLDTLYIRTDTKTKKSIISALRFFPYEMVESRILKALKSHHKSVRTAAITSLGYTQSENAAGHLLALLTEDNENQYNVIKALGQLRSSKAVPMLKELFVYGNHRIKKEILTACHRIRTPQAVSVLIEGVTDFDASIRHQASTLLSTDPRAL
jgi:hypothetical protein